METEYDKQKKWQEEIKQTRQLAIRNLQREDELIRPTWERQQQELYPYNIHLGAPFESIQEVLIKQFPLNANPQTPGTGEIQDYASQTALVKLNTITTEPSVSEYIIQHLTAEEIAYFNQYFDKIKREIKKNFHSSGLDRDAFVNLIKNGAVGIPTLPPLVPQVPQYNQLPFSTPMKPNIKEEATPVEASTPIDTIMSAKSVHKVMQSPEATNEAIQYAKDEMKKIDFNNMTVRQLIIKVKEIFKDKEEIIKKITQTGGGKNQTEKRKF